MNISEIVKIHAVAGYDVALVCEKEKLVIISAKNYNNIHPPLPKVNFSGKSMFSDCRNFKMVCHNTENVIVYFKSIFPNYQVI